MGKAFERPLIFFSFFEKFSRQNLTEISGFFHFSTLAENNSAKKYAGPVVVAQLGEQSGFESNHRQFLINIR